MYSGVVGDRPADVTAQGYNVDSPEPKRPAKSLPGQEGNKRSGIGAEKG